MSTTVEAVEPPRLIDRDEPTATSPSPDPDVVIPFDSESGISDDEDDILSKASLINLWIDRLKIISILTTFFASTEATILGIISPGPGQAENMSTLAVMAIICITLGLVLHILGAFISFLGEFLLARCKHELTRTKENKVNTSTGRSSEKSRTAGADVTQKMLGTEATFDSDVTITQQFKLKGSLSRRFRRGMHFFRTYVPSIIRITSKNGINQSRSPNTRIPRRFHFMCATLTVLGFMSSLVGIICHAYDRLPPVIGCLSAIVIFICLLATLLIFFGPEDDESEKES